MASFSIIITEDMMKIVVKLIFWLTVVFSCSGQTAIQGCVFNGKTYESGDLRWDECNSCACGEDGNWFCTIAGCATGVCYHNGEEYKDGQTFKKDCNVCTCSAKNADEVGYASCTEIGCITKPPCFYKENTYKEGYVRYEDCNSCSCSKDGQWRCTEIGCPKGVCYHNGEQYKDGEKFKIDCNLCTCIAKKADKVGILGCTKKLCPKSLCHQERDQWKSSPIGIPPPGAFVPKCNPDGSYTNLQCHGSIGECWCVDPASGKEKTGTRTNRGDPPPRCTCLKPCLRIYKPVCGSDGRTYPNKCELENIQCKDKSLYKKHEFTCKDDIDDGKIKLRGKILLPPTFPPSVPRGSCLSVKVSEEILCEGIDCDIPILSSIQLKDPKVFLDGTIPYKMKVKKGELPYVIEASLSMGWCRGPDDSIKAGDYFHDIAYSFSAPEDGSFEVKMDISLIGYKIKLPPKPLCLVYCPAINDPQCGSNGKTYDNKCSLDAAKSCGESSLQLLHKGKCEECPPDKAITCTHDPCAQLFCEDYPNAVCKANYCGGCKAEFYYSGQKIACEKTKCSQGCPLNFEEMCGSDGNTYSNRCLFEVAQCEDKSKSLYLQNEGPCKSDKKTLSDEAADKITVQGNILLPPTVPAPLPKGSCLSVMILEERLCGAEEENCNVPVLASTLLKHPKLSPDGAIPYQLSVKKSEVPYIIQASLSMGWCRGPDDSIKAGDYFHDIAYSFSAPEDGSLKVKKDISLIGYKTTSLSDEAECPKDVPIAACTFEPCAHLICNDYPKAVCKPNFCGGCNADFYVGDRKVTCGSTRCSQGCPLNYDPICGSDGETYSNECVFRVAQCEDKEKRLYVQVKGTCPADKITVQGNILLPPTVPVSLPKHSCLSVKILEELLCGGEEENCDVPVLASTQLKDPKLLPGGVIPYQLSVKKSELPYIIDASLSMGWCSGPDDSIKAGDYFHDIAYSFSAPEDGSLKVKKDIPLIGFKISSDKAGSEKKCLKACPFIYEPVCTSDGHTLDNMCLFEIEKCKKGSLEIAHQGVCEECPKGVPIARCVVNPCDATTCPANPDAECRANYCGGCNAEFFDDGKKVSCAPKPKVKAARLLGDTGSSSCSFVCPALYYPICGSDRKTHPSECLLKLEACTTQTEIFKVHNGPCGHCKKYCNRRRNPKCGSDGQTYGNQCELDRAICKTAGEIGFAYDGSCAKPKCPQICTTIYAPQCGSDGMTYSSMCNLQAKSCSSGGKVKFAYAGACRECSAICTREYDPYCGTDGKTHSNKCLMNFAVCKSGGRVQLKYKGKCENPSCPKRCPRRRGLMCGTDGKVYRSLCKLQKKTCQSNGRVYLRHFGVCEKRCKHYKACSYKFHPYCGTDGKTYRNMCMMRGAICRSNGAVQRAHSGKCRECPKGVPIVACKKDPCQQAYCPKYPRAVCRATFCGGCYAEFFNGDKKIDDCGTECSAVCTKEFFPQCGSDGKTYANHCLLAYAKCQSKGKVWLVYSGECRTRFYKK